VLLRRTRCLRTGVANFLQFAPIPFAGRKGLGTRRHSQITVYPATKSGVRKFEVDLRRGAFRLAASPLKITAVVFLSPESAVTARSSSRCRNPTYWRN